MKIKNLVSLLVAIIAFVLIANFVATTVVVKQQEKLLYSGQNMQKESEGRSQSLMAIQIIGIVISGFCLLLILVAIFRMLAKLSNVNNIMQEFGKGNLTERVKVTSRKDELDDTLFEVNRLGENITSIVGEIYATNTTLLRVSKEFAQEFESISSNSESMKKRSLTVAAASEESTASIHSISSAAEEMSVTIQTVATSMDQMNSTINEIAKNCQTESRIAADAQRQGSESQQQIMQLGRAAKEIGSIIDVITNIADKTRMLSLNATIEAASAGEAGKGFAVVANEVKELSRQTTNSAEEIRQRIEAMMKSSDESTKSLLGIVSIIEDVNSISQTIVAAVEEQSSTAGEIAKNISQGSIAANEIARNVSETATAITQVSSNIQQVSSETAKVSDSIVQSRSHAKQLGELGENLRSVVSMFKIRTAFFEWTDELSVGISEVDTQHKKLIAMINSLNEAIAEGRAREAIQKVIDELADYTVSHFGMEERYFKQYNYPEYTAHKGLHDRFVAKVNEAREGLTKGRAMIGRDIMIFLKEWLVEHIMKTDKRYAPFLRKHGVR